MDRYKDPANKPKRNSAAYFYAVWLFDKEAPGFKEQFEQQRKLSDAMLNAIDSVTIGDPNSEQAHGLQGPSGSALFREQAYRHGQKFSWNLEVATERPSVLVVTYWGEDTGRKFDVLANDQVIATQILDNQSPGKFFTVRYKIPFELVKDKTDDLGQKVNKIRIEFRGHAQSLAGLAGGVFGVRTEKE